ncbi:MAG: hypothetical protein CBC16_02605 [Verrucomicrobia bacterium TMED56]|nr:MAG: hypothetical protein CBC16_02605 [Verrucomicrobia bacterium TMED56]
MFFFGTGFGLEELVLGGGGCREPGRKKGFGGETAARVKNSGNTNKTKNNEMILFIIYIISYALDYSKLSSGIKSY